MEAQPITPAKANAESSRPVASNGLDAIFALLLRDRLAHDDAQAAAADRPAAAEAATPPRGSAPDAPRRDDPPSGMVEGSEAQSLVIAEPSEPTDAQILATVAAVGWIAPQSQEGLDGAAALPARAAQLASAAVPAPVDAGAAPTGDGDSGFLALPARPGRAALPAGAGLPGDAGPSENGRAAPTPQTAAPMQTARASVAPAPVAAQAGGATLAAAATQAVIAEATPPSPAAPAGRAETGAPDAPPPAAPRQGSVVGVPPSAAANPARGAAVEGLTAPAEPASPLPPAGPTTPQQPQAGTGSSGGPRPQGQAAKAPDGPPATVPADPAALELVQPAAQERPRDSASQPRAAAVPAPAPAESSPRATPPSGHDPVVTSRAGASQEEGGRPTPTSIAPNQATGPNGSPAAQAPAGDAVGAPPPAAGLPESAATSLPQNLATTAQSFAAPTRPAALQPVPLDQVAVYIHRAAEQGADRIRIRLHPAELGHIEVKLTLASDGAVRAVVSVDRPETFDLLHRDARGLERALQDAGLKTDGNSLSFNLRGDGESQPQGQRRPTAEPGGSPRLEQEPASPMAPAPVRILSDHAIDIRV